MKKIITYLFTAAFTLLYINSNAQIDSAFNDHSPKIIVSPNPAAGDYFFIENDSASCDHVDRLIIFNSNGVVLQNKELKMMKGTTKQQIDISGYHPGNYFIRIVDVNDPYFSFATQLVVN